MKALVWACLFLLSPPFSLETGPADSETRAAIIPFLSLLPNPFSRMHAPLLEEGVRRAFPGRGSADISFAVTQTEGFKS